MTQMSMLTIYMQQEILYFLVLVSLLMYGTVQWPDLFFISRCVGKGQA
jgi:hypothetical protein